jgi:branched-chain amino acid transport system permease protein
VTLDIILLTLLVITAYAAAMVGQLKSLPLTFAGGLALGLAETYTIGELPTDLINKIKPALPTIFLYLVLLVLPQVRLRAGRVVSSVRHSPKVATRQESIVGVIAFCVLAVIVSRVLPASDLTNASTGIVFAMIMLSLVLLVGFAGQISLAQMTFVGLGAFAMGKYFGGASIWGIVAAAVIAGAVGAIAALPALRLQGLYLALSTLAFAQGMSTIFFKNENVFGYGGRLAVGRPSLLGIDLNGDRAYFVFICVVFALMGMGVVAVRRAKFGRRLIAMKDSPAACATLGLNLTYTKLAVFALSSAIAGVAGCFYGGVRGQVGPGDFEMLQSLVLLLLVSIAGINTVTGAFAGGITFGMFQSARVLRLLPKSIRGNFSFIGAGVGAMGIGRNPNGWTSEFGPLGEKLRAALFRTGGSNDQSSDGTLAGGDGGPTQQEVKELAGTPS